MQPKKNRWLLRCLVCAVLVLGTGYVSSPARSAPGRSVPGSRLERVSVAANGDQANASLPWDGKPRISANGRLVVFSSPATNLVPGDTNGKVDIFLVDRQAHTIERITNGLSNQQANGDSYSTDMTPDGRYIVFYSKATNLVPTDTNGVGDVFVYDNQEHTIVRISVSSLGAQADANSAEGHISYDGSQVAFSSLADNLASETGALDYDVFVRDRDTDTDGILDEPGSVRTFRISIGPSGTEPDTYNNLRPNISGNGRYVSFMSDSTNLVSPPDTDSYKDVFVLDRDADGNGVFDDIAAGGTHMAKVSVDPDGNAADGDSYLDESAPMSENGRYISFPSDADNLVQEDFNGYTDIFVRDLQTQATSLVSYGPGGVAALEDSYEPYISSDGSQVAFQSSADNLVSGDTNGWDDCIIHDMKTGDNLQASLAWDGSQGNASSALCAISAGGNALVFFSDATNLVPNDTNGKRDAFVFELFENVIYLPLIKK